MGTGLAAYPKTRAISTKYTHDNKHYYEYAAVASIIHYFSAVVPSCTSECTANQTTGYLSADQYRSYGYLSVESTDGSIGND